jgi:glycosyl transferase family 1
MKVVGAIYSHLDFYQPTQHAIRIMSNHFEKVIMLSRNLSKAKFQFKDNVTLKNAGRFSEIRASEKANVFLKIYSFFIYCIALFQILKKNKPRIIIFYDHISLFAYKLIRIFFFYRPIVWYHNHDVFELHLIKKFSIGWWAAKSEKNMLLKHVDIFSLPAVERKIFFPVQDFKGKFFFIPNYPLLQLFEKYKDLPKSVIKVDKIKLLYQGTLSKGHGFEELISILNEEFDKKNIELNLIGHIPDSYKQELLALAKENNVSDKFKIYDPVPYSELADFTMTHHIGIGISKPLNIVYQTGGTASNKIYEYAALGMPVLVYDNPHYREHLNKYNWAYFTDCSPDSLKYNIRKIINEFPVTSGDAKKDFYTRLNFEHNFAKVLGYLQEVV